MGLLKNTKKLPKSTEECRVKKTKKRNTNKKSMPTFSKIIITIVLIATLAVTIYTCIMVYDTKDTTPLCYLIPAIFAELAAATGFYYTKAKNENKIKLTQGLLKFSVDLVEEHGKDTVDLAKQQIQETTDTMVNMDIGNG